MSSPCYVKIGKGGNLGRVGGIGRLGSLGNKTLLSYYYYYIYYYYLRDILTPLFIMISFNNSNSL